MFHPKIAVIGLGYVGLPLALAFARKFEITVGFDINEEKLEKLRQGVDILGEGIEETIRSTSLTFTSNPEDLRESNFFVVGVPTPIDENHRPDLRALEGACSIVGKVMPEGSILVFESTVYPGVTEEFCGPILERVSGLKQGEGFKLGYSPERINPGDKEHTLEKIVKVVSGEDEQTLQCVSEVYETIIEAGIHRAPSIKVAEAGKVIENTQRDLNIALMNELAIIFDRMGISTQDVLDAAASKWNFHRFTPGLVGGHCIGVDPYYLTTKAEQLGYHPQVILAGRRINDNMGHFVAQRMVKLMVNAGIQIKGARVGVLGITFKENVSDLRNSRVPDIVSELKDFGVIPLVHDPLADVDEAKDEYGIELVSCEEVHGVDGLVLAVAHREYQEMPVQRLLEKLKNGGVLVDIKAVLDSSEIPSKYTYWTL